MRYMLFLPLFFIFPPLADANTNIHIESHATGETATTRVINGYQTTSTTSTTTTGSTHIYTNVNGKETTYDSDKPEDVHVTNDGTTTTTVTGSTQKATISPSPTSAKMKITQASEEAKIKARVTETQKKTITAQLFDLKKFFTDLINRIFHRR